jgi:hypothetical protein
MIKEFIKTKFDHIHEAFGRNYYHDPFMLTTIVISALEIIAMIMILLFTIRNTGGLIPIAYNSIYGVISLGSWFELYLIVFGFASIVALNLIIAWAYFDKERLISYLLGFCNIILGSLGIIIISNLVILGGR